MATRNVPESTTVLLIAPWYGGSAGGVAVSSETIAGALSRLGYGVIVLAFDSPTAHRGRFGEQILPVISYGKDIRRAGIKSRIGYWRRFCESGLLLAKLKLRHRGMIAHFQYCVPAYAPLRTWCRVLGVRIVTTFRGSDINELEPGSEAAAEVHAMIRDADALTAVSEGLLAALHERFPEARDRSCVVRNVIPIDVWESAREMAPDEPRDIDILYLGNIENIKGPDLLLDAFRELVKRRPDTSLYFVGSGVMEADIRAAVRQAGLGERVTFAGRARREEVAGWLRRTRVLALPSRAEGLPLSAIEAQLLGIPVVAHGVGGVPQAVRDNETGVLVPLGDTGALAQALERLLSDEQEWREFSMRARDWAITQFNPERMANQYAALYACIAGRVTSAGAMQPQRSGNS